ncbi:hypothetical protein WNZ14_10840 [Hoeflea sp. AS60]|uniref:hypothetical protein n=1 Tax=Hoeflea sp. AS60 TaxID=3135780 RepID=UPI0031773314
MADMEIPDYDTVTDHAAAQEAKRLVGLYPGNRLKKFSICGNSYWLKRSDRPAIYPVGKLLHGIASPILYPPIIKSSPLRSAVKRTEDEFAKSKALNAVGIPSPPITLVTPTVFIAPDLGQTLYDKISEFLLSHDHQSIDALLRRATASLGRLHAAGLIHGRPNLRDMFEHQSGDIGFFDFEEVPERSMPFADAAARDFWLFAFQLAQYSSSRESAIEALLVWVALAPREATKRVAVYYHDLKTIMYLARFVSKIKSGRDLRQFIGAYDLISQAIEANPKQWHYTKEDAEIEKYSRNKPNIVHRVWYYFCSFPIFSISLIRLTTLVFE